MKNVVALFIASGLALLGTSCTEKEELLETCSSSCTTVTGRLVTANGSAPIAGATVTLKWHYGQGMNLGSKAKTRTTTDANGKYQVSFYINDNELAEGFFSVKYDVDKSRYYTIGEPGVAFPHLKRDTLVTVPNYIIPRKAFVRLAVTNPQQIPSGGVFMSDFNTCYGTNNTFGPSIQGGGAVVNWQNLPSENPLPVAGDQPIIIRSYKTQNGVTTQSSDTLAIPAVTTKTYTATY